MGRWPIFCFCRMHKAPDQLTEIVRRPVEAMGYELVGVELLRQGRGLVLRVYIDSEDGITLDDCTAVSHQLSGVLDVDDPIHEHYDLEVSSPGLDRPLFGRADFERFRGRRARIGLSVPLEGRRRFKGILAGVEDEDLLLDDETGCRRIPLAQVVKARLDPEF